MLGSKERTVRNAKHAWQINYNCTTIAEYTVILARCNTGVKNRHTTTAPSKAVIGMIDAYVQVLLEGDITPLEGEWLMAYAQGEKSRIEWIRAHPPAGAVQMVVLLS